MRSLNLRALSLVFAVLSLSGTVQAQSVPIGAEERSKAPVIVGHPVNVAASVGATARFSVRATGRHLSYQWYVNGKLQSGIDSPDVEISNVRAEYNGTRIYAIVSNRNGAAASGEAILFVQDDGKHQGLSISSFRAVPNVIKAGQKTRLEAVFTGGQGIITPGNLVIGSNQYIEVIPSQTTTYTLTVKDANQRTMTATETITVARSGNHHLAAEEENTEIRLTDPNKLSPTPQEF